MFEVVFVLLGAPVTRLELLAFVLALANIACNVREIHWGWPLAFVASLLYAWLFESSGLYGEMAVNLFFAATAVWGWWQWLRGSRTAAVGGSAPKPEATVMGLQITRLTGAHFGWMLCAWMALWLACAWLLHTVTDSTVPWVDAFVTAGSVVGTVLLGRKYVENWPVWVMVNTASIGLFLYKGLALTALLYAIFLGMALWGWAGWQSRMRLKAT